MLDHTAADGIMVGKGRSGNPWIFREIAHYLTTGTQLSPPTLHEVRDVMLGHLQSLYDFYGDYLAHALPASIWGGMWNTVKAGLRSRKAFNQLETASNNSPVLRILWSN